MSQCCLILFGVFFTAFIMSGQAPIIIEENDGLDRIFECVTFDIPFLSGVFSHHIPSQLWMLRQFRLSHNIKLWHEENDQGEAIASGVYIYTGRVGQYEFH